jgi:hypothetical protein
VDVKYFAIIALLSPHSQTGLTCCRPALVGTVGIPRYPLSVPVDIKSAAIVAPLVPPTQLSRLRCTQLAISFLFYIQYVTFHLLHGV